MKTEEFKFEGTGKMSREPLRQPFVGEIVAAVAGCQCDACKAGEAKLAELGGRATAPKLHIQIQPLDETYNTVQHEWLTPSSFLWSRKGLWEAALEKLQVDITYYTELEGYVFKFENVRIVDKISELTGEKPPANLPDGIRNATAWVPVELVETPEKKEKQEF
ncbi:MAG: hypothetical protein ACXQS1_05830 [Methermicoccaceae archaeon]